MNTKINCRFYNPTNDKCNKKKKKYFLFKPECILVDAPKTTVCSKRKPYSKLKTAYPPPPPCRIFIGEEETKQSKRAYYEWKCKYARK